MNSLKAVSILVILFMSLLLFAQTPQQPSQTSLKTTAPAAVKPAAKSFSGSLNIARANSLYMLEGNSAVASVDTTLLLGYKLNDTYSLGFRGDYSQDLKTPEASDFARARISASRNNGGIFRERILTSSTIKWSFPVAKAHFTQSLIGTAAMDLDIKGNPDHMISKKLELGFLLTGARNFHKFETTVGGEYNTEVSLTKRVYAGWSFTDKLAISALFDHISAWNYAGALKESYAHNEEIGYQLFEQWNFAIGHTYGNPAVAMRKPNGSDYNLYGSDEMNSIVYGQVTYTF